MSHLLRMTNPKIFFIVLTLLLCSIALKTSVFPQPKSSTPEDSFLFREGEIHYSKGEIEKALWRFKSLTTDYPRSPLFHEAKFRMALCYTQLKRHREAIRALNDLLPTFLSPARMLQVFSLLGDNYFELKDRTQALLWYGKGLLIQGQSHDELKKKVRTIIDSFDTEEELNQVELTYRGAYAGGYAKLKIAQKAKAMGYDAIARKIFNEIEKEYSQMDYVAQVKKESETTPPPKKSKYVVGVVLPLSGIHKPFGEKVLQAIRLAFKEKDKPVQNPLAFLSIRDSKGTGSEVEKAIEELVKGEKAIAIIGPLLSITGDQAARKVQHLNIPLLSLTQKEPSSLKGDYFFQNSLTPIDQIQTLLSFAMKVLRLRTFAVFYPNSPYGLHFKNLFSQEVARQGGKMIGSVIYQEGQTDFRQEIKGFFKVEPVHQEGGGKRKEEEFKQRLFVDGLFIPDTHDRVGTLLTQFAYFDIQGITFLGTNAWNGPELIKIAGRAAEGALFVDAFSKGPWVRDFIDEFQREYRREPDTLEAIAYDGAKFLRDILKTKGPSSPAELKEELSRYTSFQGVSGLKGFREDGKAIRNLSILRVKNGKIEPYDSSRAGVEPEGSRREGS